ncbi:hypothetical protein C7212DRAFT_362281 [Tuber magnatum]|uniref:Uncharacterized protein n=1 Tax=Tuber magnatum TaxID=42249 RepID=A0A317SVZ6_9PEZI|nr:hypothetical protein C7212DRAFT_362281 [Tuber magnatum]
MEDWGSPWADDEKLGDKDDGKLPPSVKDVEEEEEEEEGNNLEKEGEEEVVVAPATKEKRNVGAAGLTVDWDSGFADSSAWANTTPRERVRDEDGFGWGALHLGDFSGVGAKDGGGSGEEEEVRIKDDRRGSGKDGDANLHPIATDEVNAWGASSDWGDPRTPESRIEGPNDALILSLDEVGDNTPDGRFDTEAKDLPTPDVERRGQLIGAANLLSSPKKRRTSDRAAHNVEESSENHSQAVLEAVSDPTPLKSQEGPNDASPSSPEPHLATLLVCGSDPLRDDPTSVNAGDQDDGDDDFGDFATEGGEFEEPQASIPEPALPAVIKAPPPDSFGIDVSLVLKLYPIPTSRPDPPPIEDIISSTESRKIWYRLSTSGTIRRSRSSDDDYVRVMWVGSKVQESVNKIVEKWMTEDRNSGGSGLMGGGKRLEGCGSEDNLSRENRPASIKRRPLSESKWFWACSSPRPKPTLETCLDWDPEFFRVASFGWSSTQPQSGPGSVEGKEKSPSTPLRTNPHNSTKHSLPSQLTPEKISTAPHSPTTDNESAGRSMVAASTTISPTHSPTTGTKNSLAAPAPEFLPAVENSITTYPLPAGLPADTQAVNLASASGFGDWGALENISANAPPASTNIQSHNYDEWGAFEDLALKEAAPVIGSQNPPVATSAGSAARALMPSVQSSSESDKKLNSAQTAPKTADTTINGRVDLEPLSPQLPKSRTSLNISSSHENQNTGWLAWSELKDQKTSQSYPVEDSREGLRLPTPPTSNVPGSESFISAPMNGSAFDGIKEDPVISNAQTQQDGDEGDDWGEMVQSPIMPTGVLGFTEALMVPAPTSSQDITNLSSLTPPTSSIPQRIPALDPAPIPLSAPAQATHPTSAPSSTLSPGDFEQKLGDSWDLSFFEGPPTPSSGFSIPKDIPAPASQDLWDTPAVVQGKAPESANDKVIREIVEGLPDLSYMLG